MSHFAWELCLKLLYIVIAHNIRNINCWKIDFLSPTQWVGLVPSNHLEHGQEYPDDDSFHSTEQLIMYEIAWWKPLAEWSSQWKCVCCCILCSQLFLIANPFDHTHTDKALVCFIILGLINTYPSTHHVNGKQMRIFFTFIKHYCPVLFKTNLVVLCRCLKH